MLVTSASTPFAHSSLSPSLQATQESTTSPRPIYEVSLDANSVSQTDVNITSNASQKTSFRIGAVVNSSTTSPLKGFTQWRFGITYNSTAFVPQGEPSFASYPDGAANTALFGAQADKGTIDWARLVPNAAYGGSRNCLGGTLGCSVKDQRKGEILVYFAILSEGASLTLSANTLLANINFELKDKPSTPQSFNITDVAFLETSINPIPGVIPGPSVTEIITNQPPLASFTASPDPNLGQFAYTFNATGSYDSNDAIPDPGGYFWDFGDGTQDLGITGSIVTHNYEANGTYIPTLRVQDSLGATGAARNYLGSILLDNQPSHTRRVLGSPPVDPPVASFTTSTSNPVTTQDVSFDGSPSSDPGGFIQIWSWSFGDGSQPAFDPLTDHYYTEPGNYTATLTLTDNRGLSTNSKRIISVHSRPADDLAITALFAPSHLIETSWKTGIDLEITNYGTNNENASVTAYYGSHVIGTANIQVPAGDLGVPCFTCSHTIALTMNWDTTGVAPGNYTVSATVSLNSDRTPSDNTATTRVIISPFREPIVTADLSRGQPGTTILIQGSNFPPSGVTESLLWVSITFDGKQVGLVVIESGGGVFYFRFSIPPSHAGRHVIEAHDLISGASASVVLHVVPFHR